MGYILKAVIAIALMGLIAALGLNFIGDRYNDSSVDAKATAIVGTLNDASGSASAYYMDNFAYPADMGTLVTDGYLSKAPTGYTTDGTGAITYTGDVTADLCTEIDSRNVGSTCTANSVPGTPDGTVVL